MLSRIRRFVSLATLALLVPASAFAAGSLFDKGAAPPGPADDIAPSMGVFRIVVDAPWQPWFNANLAAGPFWDPVTGKLTSPVLYDNTTTIGRSAAHTQGSAADVGGASVGTAATSVKDGDMMFPPGYNSANPSRYEVHTEVRKLNLTDGPGCGLTTVCSGMAIPLSVTGGSGNALPVCPGEIEANGVDGFPAKSFFDVFVTVDIGSGIGGFGPVANNTSDPLLVTHDPINDFPPKVVYIHENPAAVPVYFTSAGSTTLPPILNWNAGDRFGYLVLAGHAEDSRCADSTLNCDDFWNQVTSGKEMCLPGSLPGIGEWGTIALATLLLLAGLWAVTRRRQTSLA